MLDAAGFPRRESSTLVADLAPGRQPAGAWSPRCDRGGRFDVALESPSGASGCDAAQVHWVHADARTWSPGGRSTFGTTVAVMHFLTSAADLQRYLHTLNTATGRARSRSSGASPPGPTHCSGLPVMRRDAEDLAEVLSPQWSLVTADRELHATPGGAEQPFTWAAFVRSGAAVGSRAAHGACSASGRMR